MPVPESKWQPYNMPQYNHEIETIDELRRLGTFGLKPPLKPVRTPVAILGSLGVCIYVPASRHWLISYSPIHLT